MKLYGCGLLLTCLLISSGCGKKTAPPEFAKDLLPVTGTVTLKGQPLGGAVVQFLTLPNSTGGEMAEAMTDADGSFVLSTRIANASANDRQGALPGEYIVTVSCITMPDGSPLPPGTTEADALAVGAIEAVPAKFSHPETTPLRVKIAPDALAHVIELK